MTTSTTEDTRPDVDPDVGCAEAALSHLLSNGTTQPPIPLPRSPDALRQLVDQYGVLAWLGLLVNVAAQPWAPDSTRLADLAREAGLPGAADVVDECARLHARRREDDERREVADEIRRLIATGGCSQRQFARHIGTSASRLSTYVNGIVVPSATMMVRIRRAAEGLAQV
jgi:hypothetical protein